MKDFCSFNRTAADAVCGGRSCCGYTVGNPVVEVGAGAVPLVVVVVVAGVDDVDVI